MSNDQPPYDRGEWRAAPDVLATTPDDEPARRAPWAVVIGAAVLVLALVGGVTYAVGSLSGGGDQPADALPAGAFAAVSFDLDPSAGQKLDAFRFVRKFPALREKVPLDGDLRQVLFEALAPEVGWDDVDYEPDVEPWLGKRLAFAAYPPVKDPTDDHPTPAGVLALQVTDRDKAEVGLKRLVAAVPATDGGSPTIGWAFSGDYVLITETDAEAEAMVRKAEKSSLADTGPYADDVAAAGDGVAVVWADMAAAAKSMGETTIMPLGPAGGVLGGAAGTTGRTTLVARFDGPDVFEVVGRVTDAKAAGWATHPVTGLEELPESSAVALGLADGDELVPRAYAAMRKNLGEQGPALDEGIASLEDEFGVQMPDDLAALLGDNLVAALDGERSDGVEVGARVTTDVAAAQAVLDKLEPALGFAGGDLPVRREVGGDLIVASSDRQADRLSESGTLGDVPAFRQAMPDLDDASFALWVDPVTVFEALFGGDGEVDENLEPIDGLGVTVSSPDDDTATYRLRLVAH